jgi:uncharacterized protein
MPSCLTTTPPSVLTFAASTCLLTCHLSFLEKNAMQIKAAGPLRAPSGDPAGGLWIVEADSPDVVDALVKEDPFWPTGLRRSVRILSWSQVFAEGRRLI